MKKGFMKKFAVVLLLLTLTLVFASLSFAAPTNPVEKVGDFAMDSIKTIFMVALAGFAVFIVIRRKLMEIIVLVLVAIFTTPFIFAPDATAAFLSNIGTWFFK